MAIGDRHGAVDKVLRTVRARYHDRALNGVRWDSLGRHYRAVIDTATTTAAAYDVLQALTGTLADAHTRVHDPVRTLLRQQQAAVTTGVLLRPVEGQLVVMAVDDSLRSDPVGIQVGDRVLTVDGRPTASVMEALVASSATGSEHSSRFRAWSRVLEGPPGSSVTLTVEDTLGTTRTVTLSRRVRPSVPVVQARVHESGVVVIRWDGFRSGIAAGVDSVLAAYPDAPGVVLDLRWNGGGSATEAGRVIGSFLPGQVVTAQTVVRGRWLFWSRERRGTWEAGRTGGQRYAGPLAVLLSPRSASGAELTANALQEEGRALVVGERSCGCLLGIRRYEPLPGGGELAVSEVGIRAGRSGRRVEHDGVHPDLPVSPTRKAIARGVDEALERAVARLRSLPVSAQGR